MLEREKCGNTGIDSEIDPAAKHVSKELRTHETTPLSRGMYVRAVVFFDYDISDMMPLIKKIKTIDNVTCAESSNPRSLTILLFIDDRFSHHHFPEKAKYIMWRKHDMASRWATGNLQKSLEVVIPSLGIDTYQVFYATTNPGSFYTRTAGVFGYKNGERSDWDRFYTCANESVNCEEDKELNGVRGYWGNYSMVTGDDRIFTEGMYSKD